MHSSIDCIFWLSTLHVLNCLRTLPGTLDTKSHWLHLFGSSPISIGFKMSPQSTWIGACIVIMTEFLLFATVCYQMCPQMVRLRGGIVTSVALV